MSATYRTVEFGSLELESSDSKLRLSLSSAAQFAAYEEDDINSLRLLTAASLSSQSHRNIWVRKGQGYSLVVKLRTNNTSTLPAGQTIGHVFASRLKHAKIWSRLQLSVSSLELTSTEDLGTEILTLSLDHVNTPEVKSRKRLHKLAQDVPYFDTRPPAGIPSITLQAVHLTACLSATQGIESSGRSVGVEADSLRQEHRDVESEARIEKDVINSDLQSSLVAGSTLDSYPTPPSSQETAMAHPISNSTGVSHEQALQLLEGAVRLAICDSPTRLSTSIAIRSSEALQCLSDVLPELWSPTYCCRVAGRSMFLPTIAHAFVGIAQHSITQSSLTSKVAQIDRQTLYDASVRDLTEQKAPSIKAPKELPITLWQHTAHALYDAEVARSMRLLSLTGKQCDDQNSDVEEHFATLYETRNDVAELDSFCDSDEECCSEDNEPFDSDGSDDVFGDLDEHDYDIFDDYHWALEDDGGVRPVHGNDFADVGGLPPTRTCVHDGIHGSDWWEACLRDCDQLEDCGDELRLDNLAQSDGGRGSSSGLDTIERLWPDINCFAEEEMLDF